MTMSQVYEAHKLIKSLPYCEAIRVIDYLGVQVKVVTKKDGEPPEVGGLNNR